MRFDLAQSHHLAFRDVRHVSDANDGKEVVLARRIQGDVPLNQHVVVPVHVVKGFDVWVICGIEARKIFFDVHLGHAARGVPDKLSSVRSSPMMSMISRNFCSMADFVVVAHVKGVGSQRVSMDVPTCSSPMASMFLEESWVRWVQRE